MNIVCEENSMRPIWRTASTVAASVATVAILAVGMLAYMFWPHCDGEEKVLATNRNGQSIVSVFKACTSIGTRVSQSIQLVSATGERKNILVYEPNGGVIGCKGKTFPGVAEPSAEWTDSQHVRIAIAVLSSIVEKHETVNEMSVSYELGPVLAEACDWSKLMKGSNVPTNSKADISK
jgi:hypothetical protein